MKKHTTVTITKKTLEDLGACFAGVEDVRHLLPAKLSTDPEKNYKIALKLADSRSARIGLDRAWWLMVTIAREHTLPNSLLVGAYHYTQLDAWVIAQYLAWVADALATRDGR